VSLRVAHDTGALRSKDLKRVTVDTTVQPKAITFPTDAKLLHAAIKGLNRLATRQASGCGNPICGSPRPRR
jgi:transposase, IS5 family